MEKKNRMPVNLLPKDLQEYMNLLMGLDAHFCIFQLIIEIWKLPNLYSTSMSKKVNKTPTNIIMNTKSNG